MNHARCRFALAIALINGLLIVLARGAVADDNLLGLPAKAVASGGSLVICGGGDMPEQVYAEFVARAGGKEARLVLIPTAYPFSSRAHYENYYSGWKDYDVASFDFLDTDSREEADTPSFVRPLEQATGVWIGGGYQGRLTDLYVGTRVETAVKGVLERGGVIGGTSAGAAVMSRTMIRYGNAEAVVDRGFGLLDRAVVDQHFRQRRRFERLIGVVGDHPGLVGLGIDEDTALIVTGNRLRVLGDAQVAVCGSTSAGGPVWIRRLKAGETADLVAPDQADKPERPAIALQVSMEEP